MYHIEIKKFNYTTQLFIDGAVWNSVRGDIKETVIKHAVYDLDAEWNFPPDLVDPIIEQGINDKAFGLSVLASAGKVSDKLHDETIKSINFNII